MTTAELRTVEELRTFCARGGRVKYLFFWGHESAEAVGKQCLSQWFPAKFEIEGQGYPTAEHFMMAEKARLFRDVEVERKILGVGHPGAAKQLGRTIRGFVEAEWTSARFDIVVRGNLGKFGQNPELGRFLLSTKDRVLVEASPKDRVWGIGLEESDDRARNPQKWRGLNLLGFALMEARSRLR